MFNITSTYFSFFKNTSPTKLLTYITKGLLTCYSRSYQFHGNSRSSHQRCSVRKVFLLKTPVLIKKETLAQVLSCEFCKISTNTFFTKHLWAIALCSFYSQWLDYFQNFLEIYNNNISFKYELNFVINLLEKKEFTIFQLQER